MDRVKPNKADSTKLRELDSNSLSIGQVKLTPKTHVKQMAPNSIKFR